MAGILDALMRACALAALRDRDSAITFELATLYRLLGDPEESTQDVLHPRTDGDGDEMPVQPAQSRNNRD